ncbi:DNA-directed RNA polymerase III subunit RPC6 [Nematocida homosporus]|uniref:DNA-directed RNA polymerase III subunit RPC6 n=1 Tax=Nematocida homosporus TaxID=1912981 RepID=UPI002220EB05|nr:DNA-directed RNA polymerase III subunit RPC6 [Nematocida homosporus]KAI5187448.1 DNA-directed RNA polymerase III subunit RPC6 [Nematocida homosporus]
MTSILAFIANSKEGVSTQDIEKAFPSLSLSSIVAELNRLSKEGQVDIFRTKSGIFYRHNQEEHKFATGEEKILYLLVKESGSDGIWIKDIKTKSGLHQNLITKILRSLEQRLLIKAVKSIKQNRKVYMLYDSVPSVELGDGPWFTPDGELDLGFVDAIKTVALEWIASFATSTHLPPFKTLPECQDVHDFITRAGISSIPLSSSDVLRILDLLVNEQKVTRLGTKYLAITTST